MYSQFLEACSSLELTGLMKKSLIAFFPMLFSGVILASFCPSSKPLETLHCYFNSVDNRDFDSLKIIYPSISGYSFPDNIPRRMIKACHRLTSDLIPGIRYSWAKKGNYVFSVDELYTDDAITVHFYLTPGENNRWVVAGHTSTAIDAYHLMAKCNNDVVDR